MTTGSWLSSRPRNAPPRRTHPVGPLFGTYRMRHLVLYYRVGVFAVLGIVASGWWAAWTNIDVNRESGLPATTGLPGIVLVTAVMLLVVWPALWLATVRRRLDVDDAGVVTVGYVGRRAIPWHEIRRFDNSSGLVVETTTGPVRVDAFPSASFDGARYRRVEVDPLTEQLNRHVGQFLVAAGTPPSVDSASAAGPTRAVLLASMVTTALIPGLVHLVGELWTRRH
ncbi:hypothetical protein [Angustibacter luteus]|uniref:PH domain-containing protein n=1 Tax=Angustibacter luteus TaxID=658456 RepID=A0ABW1JES4_9ACTN